MRKYKCPDDPIIAETERTGEYNPRHLLRSIDDFFEEQEDFDREELFEKIDDFLSTLTEKELIQFDDWMDGSSVFDRRTWRI